MCDRNRSSTTLIILLCVGASLAAIAPPVLAQAPDSTQVLDKYVDYFVTKDVLARDVLAKALTTQDIYVASVFDSMNELLGASFRQVDNVLRSQLAIPPGQGLLVAGLRPDGASAQSGLQQNDILLKLGKKPVAAAEDITKLLKAAGDATLPLEILRGGKPLTLNVKASQRVTLAPAATVQVEYFIGISLEPVEESLRAQLGLEAGKGVVITDVVKDSPAEKAGIVKYDIALELGGKPVGSPEVLAQLVQANKAAPTSLNILRARKPMTIPITGSARNRVDFNPTADVNVRLFDLATGVVKDRGWVASEEAETLRQRIDKLERELQNLREASEKATQRREKQKP